MIEYFVISAIAGISAGLTPFIAIRLWNHYKLRKVLEVYKEIDSCIIYRNGKRQWWYPTRRLKGFPPKSAIIGGCIMKRHLEIEDFYNLATQAFVNRNWEVTEFYLDKVIVTIEKRDG